MVCVLLGDKNGRSSSACGALESVGGNRSFVDDLGLDDDLRFGLLGDARTNSREARYGSRVCRLLMANDQQGEKE